MRASSVKLNVRPLRADDAGPEYVLIEGNQKSLEWLGKFLLEHATGESGCGAQIHPNGPGRAYFAKTALVGIYVHRLPCDHPTTESENTAGRNASGTVRTANRARRGKTLSLGKLAQSSSERSTARLSLASSSRRPT